MSSTFVSEKAPLLSSASEDKRGDDEKLYNRSFSRFVPIGLIQSFILVSGFCALWLLIYHAASKNVEKPSVCLSAGCVLASAQILSNRSPNFAKIDPCTDFRSYICGGFDETHDIRPDQSEVMTFTLLAERGQVLLRHILDSPMPEVMTFGKSHSADGDNFAKLHDAYEACQNESQIASLGLEPLKELVKSVRETFNQLEDANMNLAHTLSMLMGIGVQPLVELEIRADDKDPDVNVLYINAPGTIGLPAKEYYEDHSILEKYSQVISEVAKGFHQASNEDVLQFGDVTAQDLVDFEVKLAAASPSETDREDVQKYYNPRTLQNVSGIVPQLNIPTLIKARNSEFDAAKVVVQSPSYLKELSKILNATNKDVLEVYIVWKLIQSFASGVDAPAVVPLKRFNNALQGKEPDAKPERWRTCLRHVDNGLGWILSRLFIEKAFSEEAKQYGDQVILDIKAEFIRKLDASEWMSKEVRKVAIDKVHNINQKIGYPTASPDIRDPQQLAAYYERVNISTSNFFENILSMARNDVEAEWEKATKPVDRNEWGMTASTVNAYYNPAGNEIVFPAGIMQSAVFFPREIPDYLTYGAFGAVSGHELSHAFDSTGRHFDQNGNYTGWWDTATIEEFKRKATCFVEQYDNYTITGPDGQKHHINGRLTLGENLADAGGLSAAFNAWKRRDEERPAQSLPGLQEYTKDQLFFLSYGQVWCGKTRPAEQLRRLYSDPHSPNAARIELTVANSGEFRESFGCRQKQATCKLW